jgi:ArsR family transcriptional regulator
MAMAENKEDRVAGYADMLAALGTESRLRILRLLLAAHPGGLVVGEILAELGMSPSNLSHHLEKLKHERLVIVKREGTFLRYKADTEALRELLSFLYAECCSRSKAIQPEMIIQVRKREEV